MTISRKLVHATRGLLAAAIITFGMAALPFGMTAANADTAGISQKISRSEVIARAQDWYTQSLTYSQTATHPDVDGTNYRTDCSGFVAMALHMSAPGLTTGQFPGSSDVSLLSSSPSASTDLKAGDILDDPAEHMFLFDSWVSSSDHSQGFYAYSFGSTPVTYEIRTFSQSTWYSHARTDYNAYRYKNIIDDAPGTQTVGSGSTCSSAETQTVHLTDMRNVDITDENCRSYSGGVLKAWVAVNWAPTPPGSDDSTVIGHNKFDGFTIHVQAQKNNVTSSEDYCTGIATAINAADSGTADCLISVSSPASGTWTTDGWLHWDENNDGIGWTGPRYITGSPSVTI